MKKTIIALLVALGLVLIIVALQNENAPADGVAQTDITQDFAAAPDFALEDLDGNMVTFADFDGQPLVINSWAVWCPFCRNELPDFVAAQERFGDEVTIIAIDRQESRDDVVEYLEEIAIADDLVYLLDPEDSFYRSIGGFSMPETIFVNADGDIEFHKRGPMDLDEINQRINSLLEVQ